MFRAITLATLTVGLAASASAQAVHVSAVGVRPTDSDEVWVCNRDNGTVSVIDAAAGSIVAEIAVGEKPRTLAFSADGSKVFVANQRGDIPVDVSFITPFTGAEIRSSVSVIDADTHTVTDTLLDVGIEPYGVAVSPNGAWFCVSGFRSGTLKFFDTSTHAELLTLQFPHSLDLVAPGDTMADVDSNDDMLADLGEPRAFAITADGTAIYVSHLIPGFVSKVDLTIVGGQPTAAVISERIDLNDYAEHPILNPTPVQAVASAGTPRFLQDIALSPDGNHALVPHLLHNLNHDVNHDFAGAIDGDFANRVYPALTIVDTQNDSWNEGGDSSGRLHHELSEPLDPGAFVPFGPRGVETGSGIFNLGGNGGAVLGGSANFVASGAAPGDDVFLFFGQQLNAPVPPFGTLLVTAQHVFHMPGGEVTLGIPNNPAFAGADCPFQAAVFDGPAVGGVLKGLSNGLFVVFETNGHEIGEMGHRAGHPARVTYSPDGSRALMLNRGSEDLFLYEVDGADMRLMTVYPPRHGFVERAPFDLSTPMGDMPLGMAVVPDASTPNDDALIYVINEVTTSLSRLRVDWSTGVITEEAPQLVTITGSDEFTHSERVGQELFEDSSRDQTAGRFNNSCASCHFEGGADGNVWQRPAGPRSTMPVYGGTLGTGLILWKGVRLHMGETGPMFGGENGGNGIFDDDEVQGLVDYHEVIPFPINPFLDPITGEYTATAALGKDLYFGTNDTGLNPTGRHAGCAECHPDEDDLTFEVRGYTADFLDPQLTDGSDLGALDPSCFSLQENIVALNIRNINSGVNLDLDNDGFPDPDRNADGVIDIETYVPMNPDDDDDFTRDDPNNYLCPEDGIEGNPLKVFTRPGELFSIPTKLGAFSSGPYFHDHVAASLRGLLDPQNQQTNPTYGNATWPGMGKFANEFHDLRGTDPVLSKVQINLQSTDVDADIEALLEYIRSL